MDLALTAHDDCPLTDLELPSMQIAQEHDAPTFYRLRSISGVGRRLALVLLEEIHDTRRVSLRSGFVSYGRLGTCAKESAGKRCGTSGTKMGNAYRKWAFSEAAVLFLRANPADQKSLTRLEKKHRKGKALTVLAHQLARAVYYMLKRHTALDMPTFLRGSGEKRASLTPHWPPAGSAWTWCSRMLEILRRRTHRSTEALIPDPDALIGRPLLLRDMRR